MKYAMWLEQKLLTVGFLLEQNDIQGGESLRLETGAIINVYDNGTVMVQGRLKPQTRGWTLKVLRQILPKHTRWNDQ
jgi:hypothetical protein